MTAPGMPRPSAATTGSAFDYFDIGLREGIGEGSVINWRPIGSYMEASVTPTWGIKPGTFSFTLDPKHPLTWTITNVKRTCWHFRAGYNGLPALTGRIMHRGYDGPPGRDPYTYSGVCNKQWLQSMYAWVNNLFPPEIQVGLTGKQDIVFGPIDPTFKNYIAKVATRLNIPVHAALPLRWPEEWSQDNLSSFGSAEDFLGYLLGSALAGGALDALGLGVIGDILGDTGILGDLEAQNRPGLFDSIIALQARFTQLGELFGQAAERTEIGVSVNLWDGHGASPEVFNTSSLAALQSIIDYSSDHFLDLSQLLKPINNGLWSYEMDRAGYVFDTHLKRDRRNVQFRTDGGQILNMKYDETHSDGWRAIVGGKSPSIINEAIEIGANLALAAIVTALSFIPGLSGIGGLSLSVGDLFDDIFFAYQVFWDDSIVDEIGHDDALPEGFADNTAAWTLDGYSIAHTWLKEHGGQEEIELTAAGGTSDGRGISFGADNGTARRYRLGDIVTCWDRGNRIERYVSGVTITDKPGERCEERPVLGKDKRAKGPWDRAFQSLGDVAGAFRGFANAV